MQLLLRGCCVELWLGVSPRRWSYHSKVGIVRPRAGLSDGSIANKERNVEYNGLVSCKDTKE